ncbi:uncharacterized protein LOC127788950 [Diospyros lotus]|uniref:uncharacterized protein LOC127788950 n=1 Tax=Diospyros lotus TaxID=55363 RepID=UPI002259C8B7|nr:uncharacterized protein LOC127788950 [Diospyros lotus]
MGLVVLWYDLVCFGIVGVAFVGAAYVIWRREGICECEEQKSLYESLVVTSGEDGGGIGGAAPSGRGYVNSIDLWTSCWRGLHPLGLLVLRFASFLILSVFLIWDILDYGPSIFIYYTEWTFSLVIVYFGIATMVSANGCVVYYSKKLPSDNGKREELLITDVEQNVSTDALAFGTNQIRGTIKLQSHCDQEAVQQKAGFWGYLMLATYQACAGAVILTDLVFWCIIVPFLNNVHLKLNMLMGCMHILNAAFLLLDTAVSNLPFPWFRLAYFVLWSCCYVIFLWIIHSCGYSMWPYPFLDLSSQWVALWYFLLAVVHIPCYGLYFLLVRAKKTFFPRWFPEAFVKLC